MHVPPVLLVEVDQNVHVLLSHQPVGGAHVMVLQHWAVIVEDGHLGPGTHTVGRCTADRHQLCVCIQICVTSYECGSCWWFPCVQSRGSLLQRPWRGSPAHSASAVKKKTKKSAHSPFSHRATSTTVVFEWCFVRWLPSVPCATLGSEQSGWHQQHEWGCGRGSCICCSHTPALPQTAPEPEPESGFKKLKIKSNKSITCSVNPAATLWSQSSKSL